MTAVYKNSACSADDNTERKMKLLLSDKFPTSLPLQEHFLSLLQSYEYSGLAEEKLINEIFASCKIGNEGKFWENVWEAMIYRNIFHLNYHFIRPLQSGHDKLGPDFCFSYNQKKIWIEATSLNPGNNFPSEWLDAAEGQALSMPHEAMLLRWTNALKTKNEQLVGSNQNKGWINDGIVQDNEPFVVAINSSRLSWWPSEDRGISQLPWAVEAVYPVGPLAMSNGSIQHSARSSVKKAPNVYVPTGIFLDRTYSKISAFIGCARSHMLGNKPCMEDPYSIDEKYYLNDEYYLAVVHNPLAENPCPQNIFGNFVEYTMKQETNSWSITRV